MRGQGLRRMRGPASFTINEEFGLLIENFDDAPTLLTTWNPPYYRRLVESAGLAKAEDLLAREVAFADVDVRYLERLAKAGARNGRVTIRRANLARLEEEIDILVSPSAAGPAPAPLETTGEATFSSAWTLAGTPAITLP